MTKFKNDMLPHICVLSTSWNFPNCTAIFPKVSLQAHKLNMIKREKLAGHPRTIWRIWTCDVTATSRMDSSSGQRSTSRLRTKLMKPGWLRPDQIPDLAQNQEMVPSSGYCSPGKKGFQDGGDWTVKFTKKRSDHFDLVYDIVSISWHRCKEIYRKVSNIRRTLVGNKILDHSDVVGASPVGAAPTTSSFST